MSSTPQSFSGEGAAESRAPTAIVLLVDDELSFLVVLERLLRRRGFRCVSVSSAELALRALELWPVFAVVADYRMPEMNGLDLLDKVAERHPHVLRILLTGIVTEVEDVCRRRGHTVIDKGNTYGPLIALLRGPSE